MSREYLEQYVQSLLPVSREKAAALTGQFEAVTVARHEFLLRENKISTNTWFLEQGFVRSFTYDNKGEEVTTNIFSAPCFVNDFLSFFKQVPTQENFQTLSDCRFWTTDFRTIQQYFHEVPEFREFGRLILVHNYARLQERMLDMIRDTAEQRYRKLLEQQPGIAQEVPLKIIASYLGITDTSLSRIRKEMTRK